MLTLSVSVYTFQQFAIWYFLLFPLFFCYTNQWLNSIPRTVVDKVKYLVKMLRWKDKTHQTVKFVMYSFKYQRKHHEELWCVSFCYEMMSNCSQNCWIDWNSAVLWFKRLRHIGVWTFAWIVRPLLATILLYMGNLFPAYTMYHVFYFFIYFFFWGGP